MGGVRTLLADNPQLIKARDEEGQTALFVAVSNDNTTLVSMLLEHIADPLILNVEDQEKMLLGVLGLHEAPCIHLIQGALVHLLGDQEVLAVGADADASVGESSTAPALTAAEANAALYEAAPLGDLDGFWSDRP